MHHLGPCSKLLTPPTSYISIIWFGIAFAFSIVIAFATLGDNSTAHSLALGLLLSWVPVVVFASVVDRNPTSDTRCRVLIERWMFNVDLLFEQGVRGWEPWRAPDGGSHNGDDTGDFEIGDFMGQGRTLRYCGVTDTVLDKIANRGRAPINLLAFVDKQDFLRFQKSLTTRPTGWYVVWIISQFVVSTSFGMAFMVSFNTPTVGLGCRSLMYVIWYALTLPSWILLGIQQEPWVNIRKAMMVPNALAVIMIAGIMVVHAIGGLNNCGTTLSTYVGKQYYNYAFAILDYTPDTMRPCLFGLWKQVLILQQVFPVAYRLPPRQLLHGIRRLPHVTPGDHLPRADKIIHAQLARCF